MIASITTQTLLDFPGELSCILWTNGCNLDCSYCYNIDLAQGKSKIKPIEEVKQFLESRKGFLTAVTFCGGEPTIHGNNLIELMQYCKSLGYKVKLDTNGIKSLNPFLPYVDYIALDYKDTYSLETIHYLLDSKVPFEVRMTVHPLYETQENILKITKAIADTGYNKPFYLQYFQDGPSLGNLTLRDGMKYDESFIHQHSPLEIIIRGA